MACSKLFSGDLPEITNYILQYLQNDSKSLYSCILVNRLFCRIAIPLLWEDPFSIPISNNKSFVHFLDIYFLYSNKDDKNTLKDYGIDRIVSLSLKPPLFNYPSFLKTINTSLMELHLMVWVDNFSSLYKKGNDLSYNQNQVSDYISGYDIKYPLTEMRYKSLNKAKIDELFNILDDNTNHNPNLMKKINFIYSLLFKIFTENDASLQKLYLERPSNQFFTNNICELILNQPKFIAEIEKFSIYIEKLPSHEFFLQKLKSLQDFLSSLSLICNSIKYLELFFPDDIYMKLIQEIRNLFKSQINLSKVLFSNFIDYINNKFTDSLKSLKILKYCSNTLTTISFYFIIFTNNMLYNEIDHLVHIKCLEFIHCERPELFIQFLLTVSIPLKIKTLSLDNNYVQIITPIQLLFQNISSYLEYLTIITKKPPYFMEDFINSIIRYCEKIKFLHLTGISYENISQLFELITLFNNHLKYLTLEIKYHYFNPEELKSPNFDCKNIDQKDDLAVSSIILNKLGQLLPVSLRYLDLYLVFNPEDLKIFFENSKNIDFKNLLIRNRSKNNLKSTLNVIKEFVKKKKDLEYLTYAIISLNPPHNSLEELVKETEIFARMKKYDDLVIKASDIDGIFR